MGDAFKAWVAYVKRVQDLPAGSIIARATTTDLSADVIASYDAPFPDETFKAGARQFPLLVPDRPDAPGAAENRAAWDFIERFHKPFLCLYSDSDPVTADAERGLRRLIPGTLDQPHQMLRGGHFLQEDVPAELADGIVKFIVRTS